VQFVTIWQKTFRKCMCERVLSGVKWQSYTPDVAEEFKQLLPNHPDEHAQWKIKSFVLELKSTIVLKETNTKICWICN
jgi:hypothetical protein